MKRKIEMPNRQSAAREAEQPPRERRTLGLKFEAVMGDAVSGLR